MHRAMLSEHMFLSTACPHLVVFHFRGLLYRSSIEVSPWGSHLSLRAFDFMLTVYGEIAIETDFAKVSCVLSEWCGLVLFLRHLHMHFGFSGPEIGPIFWARKRARIGSFQKEFLLGVPEKGPFSGPDF